MKIWWLPASFIMILMLQLIDCNKCIHSTCSECVQEKTCMWCNNDTFQYTRCISDNDATVATVLEDWRSECSGSNIIELENFSEEVESKDFSTGDNIIQMKPQKVDLRLRVNEPHNITLKYKHFRNHPVDLYYLMDGSKSMMDDKVVLSKMGSLLSLSIKNITRNFRLGFGIFVDKPLLPFISTVPVSGDEIDAYGFKNTLPLTDDASEFEKKVAEAKTASNLDSPEGGLDALMQAIVCKKEIDWRNDSVKLIVLVTDAGFHYAGDGKLAGVMAPNDMACHLNGSGYYTDSDILDYPSVSQINYVAKSKGINLIFAVTKSVEPLYARLSQYIEGASFGVVTKDSGNIVDLLSSKVKDILGTTELRSDGPPSVTVRYFSKCMDGHMKLRKKCDNLKPGDQVEFEIEFTLEKCPEDSSEQKQISIYATGRSEKVEIVLTMQCKCECETEGDKGYIPDAEQCNYHGDFKCGLCSCDSGYTGKHCECEGNKGLGTNATLDNTPCKQFNGSTECSNRGVCNCGLCECKKRKAEDEIISGDFCECTNYENCNVIDGKKCAGNGECVCSECICKDGYTGQDCNCQVSQDNCKNSDTNKICSNKGTCICNECKCEETYKGRLCDDCRDCNGKCEVYKSCVQCQAYETGEYSKDVCQENCTHVNSTIVPTIEADSTGRSCFMKDENNCRFVFVYYEKGYGSADVLVLEELECPNFEEILWKVMLGVLSTVVLIGLIALSVGKMMITFKDKLEYRNFILNKGDEKWHQEENPLYKEAKTETLNPMYGKND